MIERWSKNEPRIRRTMTKIQEDWKYLAKTYCSLPLALRRDLNLGLCKERFYCAALLDPINFSPHSVDDPRIYLNPLPEQKDNNLCAKEWCPRSRKWYEPLLETAHHIKTFDFVTSQHIDVKQLDKLLNDARRNFNVAKGMAEKVMVTWTLHAMARPSLAVIAAWNNAVGHVYYGMLPEYAHKAFRAHGEDLEKTMTEGNVRTWLDMRCIFRSLRGFECDVEDPDTVLGQWVSFGWEAGTYCVEYQVRSSTLWKCSSFSCCEAWGDVCLACPFSETAAIGPTRFKIQLLLDFSPPLHIQIIKPYAIAVHQLRSSYTTRTSIIHATSPAKPSPHNHVAPTAMQDWAHHKPRLWTCVVDIQNRWRILADQYNNLPLGYRRDLSLGMWNERYSCAALLQHIAAFPQLLSDTEMFRRASVARTHDMLLGENEKCPVSFG